jgi:hypothetical protein
MTSARRSARLLLFSLGSILVGLVAFFVRAGEGSSNPIAWGTVTFIFLWNVAPVLIYGLFIRYAEQQPFVGFATVGMLMGPVLLLLQGVFGPGESGLPLFFVPVLQWLLAVPLGIWFAFSIQARNARDRKNQGTASVKSQ